MQAILPFLRAALPRAAAIKGISSASPKMKSFVTNALAAGYGTDTILGFLRSAAGSSTREEQGRGAQKRRAEGTARPDELARAKSADLGGRVSSAISGAAGIAGGLAALRKMGGAATAKPLGKVEVQAEPYDPQQRGPQQQIAGPAQRQIAGPEQQALLGEVEPEITPQAPEQTPAPQDPTPQENTERLAKVASSVQATKAVAEKIPSFFERAMEGISFLDLPEESKPGVGKLMKRLDALEDQGSNWKDKPVQKIVRGLRKLVFKKKGLKETERDRFNAGYPDASSRGQQESPLGSADEQLIRLMDQLTRDLNK